MATSISAQKIQTMLALARDKKRQDALAIANTARVAAGIAPVPDPAVVSSVQLEDHNGAIAQLLKAADTPMTAVQEVIDPIDSIIYNAEQESFVNMAASGKSCVLIGAAGSGKTTCVGGAMRALIKSGRVGTIVNDGHKKLVNGTPGIVIVAFTHRAVSNIRKALSADLKMNCMTIHALLEYSPEYYEEQDPATGQYVRKMVFEPTRHKTRPLPPSIHTIVFEESSMVGTDLHDLVMAACQHKVQCIYLGDIQQLPPVFGKAILGYKMLESPVTELVQIYRQALESPIIKLAHRVLSGQIIPHKDYGEWDVEGKLKIHPWKKSLSAENAADMLAKFMQSEYDLGKYNPDTDIVLIPFNKACGTDELNKHIANHIARKNKEITWEVICGFEKRYFSRGDRIMFDKEDAIITSIRPNPAYAGAAFQAESEFLNYWGHRTDIDVVHEDEDINDIDFLLGQVASNQTEDRVRQSSHIVTIRYPDSDDTREIKTAGDMASLILSFALTVHKAQGSGFRKVYFLLHKSHATMISRELLYTGITRAKEQLYIVCEPETFTNGIRSQRIKGNTLAEKAEFFKGLQQKD